MARSGPSDVDIPLAGTVGRLALADLSHEWLLNLCIVLALAAILAPLLLLLGLKTGVIETMRHRLVQDPVFREIKPQETLTLGDEWFRRWEADKRIAFLTPTILRGSSIVRLARGDGSRVETVDLLPSGAGDPLLLENGGVVPTGDQAVLSAPAAEKLGVAVGDTVELVANRVRAGRQETARQRLTVAAVLSPRADAVARLYTALDLVRDVEGYREGLAAPERGWTGGRAEAYASADGVLVVSPTPLDPLLVRSLALGTGFSAIDEVDGREVARRTGVSLPAGWSAVDVHVVKEPAPWSAVHAVRDKLRGRGAIDLPYTRPVRLVLDGVAEPVPAAGLSLTDEQADRLGAPRLPWGRPAEGFRRMARVLLPNALGPVGERITVRVDAAGDTPPVPLDVAGRVPGTTALVPAELLGVLRTGAMRRLVYDADTDGLRLAPPSFRGFRLYARDIDDVASLHRALRGEGIPTITQVQAIERVRTLDSGLTSIFWLIAVVGITGGLAALTASLYAAVERKSRDLSMLRLMGLPRRAVFGFPVAQGAALAATAAAVATAAYYLLASVINTAFAGDLALGERICRLAPTVIGIGAVATEGTAVLSSLLAAWHATRIDPAEAIRVE